MARLSLALALLVQGLLAGCGGIAATASAPVRTNTVDLPTSYRFDPPVIEVPAGTTVTWTNHDHFTHSVQVKDGPVHNLPPGQSVSVPFDTPGEYSYICTYHPQNMRGTVIVTAR